MEPKEAILAFSQSEKAKAGLLMASQLLEIYKGIPDHERHGAERFLRVGRGRQADADETGYEYCSIHELLDTYTHLLQKNGDLRWADRVEWLDELPEHFSGCLLGNELLDAMPVHRVSWDVKRREWFEWGVALKSDQFVWTPLPGPFHSSSFILYDS